MTVKKFKILGFCLIAACLTMATTSTASAGDAENLKIVTVNTNQIVKNHPAFINAQQTLQGEAQEMRQEMQGKEKQEQRAAQQQMQQKLQQRSRELQQDALEKVRQDIQEIADENGWDYVMDANVLLAGGEDVTEEVMKEIGEEE